MANRMLIDATHPDEARVVVVSGNKVEEFDYETATKTQVKGNIYLAKITRVEPSLQAAFVEYGGNRHGFLPFSEIHPDYYRIPIADREALLAEEAKLRGEPGGGNGEVQTLETALDRAEQQDVPEEPGGDGEADGGGNGADEVEEVVTESSVDTVGGDEIDEAARRRAVLMRRYKIQEVIKRRQVMLVQVTKEERGTKGAALTTYLSLAGRYCVLMPNTAKGGGISRKISNATDRRRLKKIVSELEIPEGMAVIVRTAGSQRTKAEIRRDYDYLLRLWDEIRTKTLESTAPDLIYEEANLIKRAIRDLYTREMDDVLVEGEAGYKAAKSFMKMLMPSHARKVKPYDDPRTPLFHRYKVEEQLEAMHHPQVELKSGGSIVIAPTEALVSIDVNSGRATRERHIEETALKTNLEAADEVARQLRLRDLAGLIVIDFIDMEESRHNRDVERRLKEALRSDRARIQLGRISPFGLLEMSRQRLRPSLFESVNDPCPTCHGTGHIRSVHSLAMEVLRALADEGVKRGGGAIEVRAPANVALHLLNEKRQHLLEMEQRFGVTITVRADAALGPVAYDLRRTATAPGEAERLPAPPPAEAAEAEEAEEAEAREEGEGRRRRSKRGGRRRRKDTIDSEEATLDTAAIEADEDEEDKTERADDSEQREADSEEDRRGKRRRRGKRGGRRRAKQREEGQAETAGKATGAEASAEAGAPGEGDADIAAPGVTETASAESAAAPSALSEPAPAEATPAEATPSETGPSETGPSETGPSEQAPGEPTAADGGEQAVEPAKPRRRSRAKKVKAEPETAAAEGEAAESGARPTPRRRTRRPRPSETEGQEAATAPADTPSADTTPATTTPATTTSSEPARPDAAQPAAPDAPTADAPAQPAAAEAPAQPAAAEPAAPPPAQPREPATVGGDGAPSAEDAAGEAAASETARPETAPAHAETAERRPRRRGWWNRMLG